MKQFTKYICAFLMIGMSVSAWGTTTTQVIFPAGTTSSYTSGEWGDHGAYIGGYPTTVSTESMCISDGVGFDVKFYYAYDGGDSKGLQLKKNSSAYVEMTIASSNGITVEVTYSATSDFDIELTGASTVTASSDNTTASINTSNTNATLKINGTDVAIYIKYIKITRKSTGTITIGHDDCAVRGHIDFSPTSISETVTPAEAESGGDFTTTVSVAGVNLEPEGEEYGYVYYEFTNPSGSGTYGEYDDWFFEVTASSSSDDYTYILDGTLEETLTITYNFYEEPSPGTYSADLIAWYWDDSYDAVEFEKVTITLTVSGSCSTSPTVTAGSNSSVTSTTATISCSSGISSLGSAGCSISSYGFVMNTTGTPTTDDTKHQVGTTYTTTDVEFSKDLTGLSPNTTYYVRPYATNGNGTAYGTQTSFTTLQRYAITYYKNDGGATSDVEYKDHGVDYTISSNKYSRSGHTLVKWHTLAAGTGGTDYALGATYSTNAILNLYAVWGGTISFNNNGGTGSMSSEVAVNGSSYSLPSCTFTPPAGKAFKCWAQGAADGTERAVGYSHTVSGNITFYAVWRDETYTDYVFSCAELTLTPKLVTASTPIFITSTASKQVRSQDSILIVGSGLTPSASLTFPSLAGTKFSVKSRKGGDFTTKADGTIDTVAYVFYTPGSGDTDDGLDKLTGFTASVSGVKPLTVSLTQDIIGRHLPTAGYVIAGKYNGKWYALPSNMSTTNPSLSEIAVDDADDPSIAYTESSNIYGLAGPTNSNISGGNGQYVRLTMSIDDGTLDPHAAPLHGSATGSTTIGKSGTSQATSDLSEGWWWKLTQTNTSIDNAKDAKYLIYCANNTQTLQINNSPNKWGLYSKTSKDVEELRLIPASSVVPTEAYFVEWAKNGGVVEVNAKGVSAYKVKAKLGAAESSLITLSETQTSAGNSSKYNYTVNFGDGIDFSANEGEMLTLEWYDNSVTPVLKAVSNIMVPKIIATSTMMSSTESADTPWSKWEVHVLPGVTLEANAGSFSSGDVTIKQLEIYPNATVNVTTGTLDVGTLIMHNGWTRAGTKKYDVARLYIQAPVPAEDITGANLTLTTAYMDWYIDYDQFYPIAVPWGVTLSSGLAYRYTKVSPTYGHDQNIRFLYYDGDGRAKGTNGSAGDGANWKFYGAASCKEMPTTLDPSKAYAMTAKRPTGKAFSIVRMTMNVPSSSWTALGEQGNVSTTYKDTVYVVAYDNAQNNAPEYSKGWNFIANPYMSLYNGPIGYTAGEQTVKYVNIPDENFREYDQQLTTTAKLKPASGVLIQAPATGHLILGTENRKLSAPSYRKETEQEARPEQQAIILLSNDGANDMMGLIISDQYTTEYEINADLEKILSDGTTLRTYMHYCDRNMAYVAINETLAKEWIPVTVRIPENGEYTFSLHEASIADELEGVYLIDYQNGDQVTNLLVDSYTFTANAGTISNRFAINAKVGERETPTANDVVGMDKDSTEPIKFLWHDKVFIWFNGVIYDATGKKVR